MVSTTRRLTATNAIEAIRSGAAHGHQAFALLANEHERDAFMIRPLAWDGPGEYQYIHWADGRHFFVRMPDEATQRAHGLTGYGYPVTLPYPCR
jgi:hypothetical protein